MLYVVCYISTLYICTFSICQVLLIYIYRVIRVNWLLHPCSSRHAKYQNDSFIQTHPALKMSIKFSHNCENIHVATAEMSMDYSSNPPAHKMSIWHFAWQYEYGHPYYRPFTLCMFADRQIQANDIWQQGVVQIPISLYENLMDVIVCLKKYSLGV